MIKNIAIIDPKSLSLEYLCNKGMQRGYLSEGETMIGGYLYVSAT